MARTTSPYIITLREIPSAGLDREFDLGGDFAREALAGTEADAESATVTARVNLQKAHDDVVARGEITGSLRVLCARCADPSVLDLSSSFTMTFVPSADEDGGEVELGPDELDVATYENEEVDLAPTLREQIVLALPMRHLCREDCKGLCAQCGQDLNARDCACAPPSSDDRWAALKDLTKDVKPSLK